MPDVFELPPQHLPGLHRQIRRFALQRLHADQFIQADRALPLFSACGGLGIHLAPLHNFLLPLLIRHGCQPVPEAVRLQPPFLRR